MALESAVADLVASLERMQATLRDLQVTALEDRPLSGEALPVERLGDAVADALGWTGEAIGSARRVARAAAYPVQVERAAASLVECQAGFLRGQRSFFDDAASSRRVAELATMADERDREWRGWTWTVDEGLDRSRAAFHECAEALLDCWREVAERLGAASITLTSTNFGNRVTAPSERVREGD